ncbi:hypothetical protein CAEBREN_11640 [Caenorhabditis brenneri]|uniref:Uncharacterized protein n=1 Tax=Caenorhabditis brenneri TaxID=135651 RepID=G0MAA2_CAEBE|nr:hypothetical protein CAEBREN_11640 [Caenorhabditis brenneri]
MTEPKGPPSLSNLACDTMIKAAKNGNLKLVPQKVPPAIRECIWDHCTLMEIITLSFAMNSTDFFSPIVNRSEITVHFQPRTVKMCFFEITCSGKANLRWFISLEIQPDDSDFKSAHSKTQMMFDSADVKMFISYFPRHAESEIVKWISKLFQKEIG